MTDGRRKKPVVPRLRFPEFRDAGEWISKRIGEFLSLEYGAPLPEEQRRDGIIPVVGSNGVVGYHSEPLIDGPAIVIGRKGSAGEVNWIDSACYPIDTTFFVHLSCKDCQLRFIHLLLERHRLPGLVREGGVPGLNRDDVYAVKTAIPKPSEQQKIADCLSSLDELIELEAQKVEALKQHKKGLMQQLFPREGETTPRLRFPEFRDAGEWEVLKCRDILNVRNDRISVSNKLPLFSLTIEDGITAKSKRYNREFLVHDRKNKKYKLVMPGDIVYNPANLRWGAIGISTLPHPVVVSPIYEVLYTKKHARISNDFVGISLMHTKQIARFSSKGQGTLTERIAVKIEDFLDTSIEIPSDQSEQQKIADCLSSLDELIELKSQKVEALKQHKKGLMQQLFPQEVA